MFRKLRDRFTVGSTGAVLTLVSFSGAIVYVSAEELKSAINVRLEALEAEYKDMNWRYVTQSGWAHATIPQCSAQEKRRGGNS